MLTAMRKIFIASIFIFTFCVFAIGQNSNCPTVSVSETSEPAIGRKEISFSASVKNFNSDKIEYVWSASDGFIITGQGTDTITVRANPNTIEFTPTVTVEIKGLAEECEVSDSETATIICAPSASLLDSFELTANPINVEGLDVLVSEVEKDSNATVSIIIYNKGELPSKLVKEKEASIKKYLSDKKVADDKISIINSPNDGSDRVLIFIVPAGATPPTP